MIDCGCINGRPWVVSDFLEKGLDGLDNLKPHVVLAEN